jgi:N-methylhydantoinase B
MSNCSFGGVDSRTERPFAYYETIAGGMGASAASAGISGTHTHMTNSWNTPVEAFEHLYPVRIRRYSLRRGSGGKGEHRGGDGIIREFEFLSPAEFTLLSDRREKGPYGLSGGEPGKTGAAFHNGREVPGRARFAVAAGDRVRIETPGGGGFGKRRD